MIRGKRLRPLAVVASVGIELGDYKVEPVTKWAPKLPEVATHFGIILPKGVPAEVIATLEKIWAEKISQVRGAAEIRHRARRAVHALLRRRRAEARVADGPGRCLDAARGRPHQDVARGSRHSEALRRASQARARAGRAAPRDPIDRRMPRAMHGQQPSPRADLVSGLGWIALGGAIVYGSWTMDRLENLNINPYTAPGPGARHPRRGDRAVRPDHGAARGARAVRVRGRRRRRAARANLQLARGAFAGALPRFRAGAGRPRAAVLGSRRLSSCSSTSSCSSSRERREQRRLWPRRPRRARRRRRRELRRSR